jgi:hypothetical protein
MTEFKYDPSKRMSEALEMNLTWLNAHVVTNPCSSKHPTNTTKRKKRREM